MLRLNKPVHWALLAAAVVCLAGCQQEVGGQSSSAASAAPTTSETRAPGDSTPAGGTLQFRAVLHVVPNDGSTPEPPASAPPPSPQGLTGDADEQPDDVATAKQQRQQIDINNSSAVQAAITSLNCAAPDPLRGQDDPALPLVTCDQEDTAIYVLEPVFLTGDEIASAEAKLDPNGTGYVVAVTFNSEGSRIWADFTESNVGRQVAFVLDTEVISAPQIEAAIVGETIITGGQGGFSKHEAEELAARISG